MGRCLTRLPVINITTSASVKDLGVVGAVNMLITARVELSARRRTLYGGP